MHLVVNDAFTCSDTEIAMKYPALEFILSLPPSLHLIANMIFIAPSFASCSPLPYSKCCFSYLFNFSGLMFFKCTVLDYNINVPFHVLFVIEMVSFIYTDSLI